MHYIRDIRTRKDCIIKYNNKSNIHMVQLQIIWVNIYCNIEQLFCFTCDT